MPGGGGDSPRARINTKHPWSGGEGGERYSYAVSVLGKRGKEEIMLYSNIPICTYEYFWLHIQYKRIQKRELSSTTVSMFHKFYLLSIPLQSFSFLFYFF